MAVAAVVVVAVVVVVAAAAGVAAAARIAFDFNRVYEGVVSSRINF